MLHLKYQLTNVIKSNIKIKIINQAYEKMPEFDEIMNLTIKNINNNVNKKNMYGLGQNYDVIVKSTNNNYYMCHYYNNTPSNDF